MTQTIKWKYPTTFLVLITLSACGSTPTSDTKEADDVKPLHTCKISFKQNWPRNSEGLDLEGFEYQKINVPLDLNTLRRSPVTYDETTMDRTNKDRSIVDSPNLNNFKLSLKVLSDDFAKDYCEQPKDDVSSPLLVEFRSLVVVKNFDRSVQNSALYCVDVQRTKLSFNVETQFGKPRKNLNAAPASPLDDLEDASALESEAPAAVASVTCIKS